MRVSESKIINCIAEQLEQVDVYELARIARELLGGEFSFTGEIEGRTYDVVFDFEPDENYHGAFELMSDDSEE